MFELIHYYDSRMSPLKSVTEQESELVVDRLAALEGRAFVRFANYEWYAEKRRQTEKWLHDAFVERGGKPTLVHPRYFVIGESEVLREAYGQHGKAIRVALDAICAEHVSFTMDDSMKLFLDEKDPRIYMKNEIIDLLKDAKSTYVEAQVWDLRYFEKDV